jgi:hypothetical protein
MTPNHGQQPPKKRAATRKGAIVAKTDGAMQPVGKRRTKAKAKPEIEPAKRITGVGAKSKPVVLAASEVSLASLSVGNGGAIIKLTEKQAASVLKPL